MVVIYPSAVLLTPLIASVFINRKWIPLVLILTVPFFSLIVFEAVGRQFSLPEIAIMFLALSLIIDFARQDSTITLDKNALLLVGTFVLLGIISAIVLVLFPSDQTTHMYNSPYAFLDKRASPLVFSRNNLTQPLLRLFSFGSIFIIYISFLKKDLAKYIRLLTYEGLVVGLIGVLYQFIILFENPIINKIRWFGFLSMRPLSPFFGPLPPLMSVPGEPGYTALYFLFLLGITTTVVISNYENILSQVESRAFTILFILFIFLTGSGTGFGGILILGTIIGFYYTFIELSLPSVMKIAKMGLFIFILSFILSIFLIDDLEKVINSIVMELTFRGGSGNIRGYWIEFAFDLFQTRPLIGYGFGSYYGLSVLGTVLVSTGMIGFCLFLIFHGHIIKNLVRISRSNTMNVVNTELSHVLTISLATIFGTMLLAKSITALLFPWYWVAVGFGLAVITDN